MQFIDFVKLHDLVKFHPWYLDDGTFIGSQSALLQLLNIFTSHGWPPVWSALEFVKM